MTDLKTLKDLTRPYCATEHDSPEAGCYQTTLPDGSITTCNGSVTGEFVRAQFKKEAIKWIKELEKESKNTTPENQFHIFGKIKWIKHFFNITDKDLNASKSKRT